MGQDDHCLRSALKFAHCVCLSWRKLQAGNVATDAACGPDTAAFSMAVNFRVKLIEDEAGIGMRTIEEQGARSRNAGSSVARTVPLLVFLPPWTKEEYGVQFNVSEEELVLGLRNVNREEDADLRQSMLRILMKHLIATSHK